MRMSYRRGVSSSLIPARVTVARLPGREEKRILIAGQFAHAPGQALITLEPIRPSRRIGPHWLRCRSDQRGWCGGPIESIGF